MPSAMIRGALLAVFAVSAAGTSSAELSAGPQFRPSPEIAAQRAPQIFNAVYDSLRKWGTMVHPNGMSLFLATVPEGVILHHGNNRNETPTEPDWLAYEIEHAEMFARAGRPGPPRGPGKPFNMATGEPVRVLDDYRPGDKAQIRVTGNGLSAEEAKHGWLHTYRTTRPLHFLYIDGMSGSKDDSGVIDTQDYLLRGVRDAKTRTSRSEHRVPGPPGEYDRALDLCDLAADWGLQGVIRTEMAGFEIIKCDFSDGLEQLQSLQRADTQAGPPRRGPRKPKHHQSVEDRYRDVGSSRTILDYSSMVSAFFFPTNLTNPDDDRSEYPRLSYTTEAEMSAIREYLSRVIGARHVYRLTPYTWRDVADLVVRRYATEISSMANDTESTEKLAARINFLFEVFVDYSVTDKELRNAAAKERCATFYLQTMPLNSQIDRLIYAAFEAVNANICASLSDIRELLADSSETEDATLEKAKSILRSLMHYLSWSIHVETVSRKPF